MSEKQLTKPDSLTNLPEFKPTPGMQLWLERSIELETDSITDIAAACKMDRQSWYDFQKKPGFLEWWETEWNKRLLGQGWKLDVIGMKNAKRDHRYWESMQKRMGRLQDKPTVGIVAQGDDMSISFE